jgi:anti-anti-sigma factor
MNVTFWGTRGSISTPEPEYMKYGGNTACIELRTTRGELIIIDAGTGIRRLGNQLLAQPPAQREASLLISHYHWDHIQGFPFFAPLYSNDWRISIYGQFKVDHRLEQALSGQMGNLYFPISMTAFAAEIRFIELIEQEFDIGSTRITSRALNHPQGNLGFRIDDGSCVLAYASDTEHVPGQLDEKVVELAYEADLLIYDAQFTPEQHAQRRGWGHSTWEAGIAIARAAGVKQLVLFHHDPGTTDAQLDRIAAQAAAALPGTIAATRDLTMTIKPSGQRSATLDPPRLTTTVRQRMRYRIERRADTVLVRPASFLNQFSSAQFKEAVVNALAGAARLVFDFSGLSELESETLDALSYFLDATRTRNIHLVVAGATPPVRDTLTISRFSQVIELIDLDALVGLSSGEVIDRGPDPDQLLSSWMI